MHLVKWGEIFDVLCVCVTRAKHKTELQLPTIISKMQFGTLQKQLELCE